MSTFLTDDLTGSAATALTAHVPDSGGAWVALSGSAESFNLDGSGAIYAAATSSLEYSYSVPADPFVAFKITANLKLNAAASSNIPGLLLHENVNNRGYRGFYFGSTLFLQTIDGGTTIGSIADTITNGNTYSLELSYDPLTQTVTVTNTTTGKSVTGVNQTYIPRYVGVSTFGQTASTNYKLSSLRGLTYEPALAAGAAWAAPKATGAYVTVKPPSGGRAPYSIQFRRAPDSGGVSGTYADVGVASASTEYTDSGLSTTTKYWYKATVTDALSATATGTEVSVTTATPDASGLVEYLLDATSSTAIDGGIASHLQALLYDDDLTLYYQSTSTLDPWIGIDLGSGVLGAVTKVQFAGTTAASQDPYMYRAELQGAGVSTGPWSHLGALPDNTIANGGVVLSYEFNDLNLTAAGGHRVFRFLRPTLVVSGTQRSISCCELRFIGYWAASQRWRPCTPVITPGAGRLANGSTCTIACDTTDALIYYTTDGSTPTTGSTLYSGAITIPSNATTTVKAIASHASGTTTLSRVVTAVFTCPKKWVNDSGASGLGGSNHNPEVLYDTTGRRMQGHYGCLFNDTAAGKLYWLGQDHRVPDSASIVPRQIYLYDLADPFNPVSVGPIILLPPSSYTDSGTYLDTVNRGKVLYNAGASDPNKKYVFVCRLDAVATGYASGQVGFVTAPAMIGPWTWQNHVLPSGMTHVGDMNIFQDPADGKWKAYMNDNNTRHVVGVLDVSTDYTSFTADALVVTLTGAKEAPAILCTGGYYYVVHSAGMAYGQAGPSTLQYRSATTLAGLNSASDSTIWASAPGSSDAAYSMQSVGFTTIPGYLGWLFYCDWGDSGASPVHMYNAQYGLYEVPPANVSGGTLTITAETTNNLSNLPLAPILNRIIAANGDLASQAAARRYHWPLPPAILKTRIQYLRAPPIGRSVAAINALDAQASSYRERRLWLPTILKTKTRFTTAGSTLLRDTFTDANGTALTAHTMDAGPGWTAVTGTYEIQGNKAVPVSNTDDDMIYTDAGTGDFTYAIDIVPFASGPSESDPDLIFRFTDSTHLWVIHNTVAGGGAQQLYKNIGAGYVLVATVAFAFLSGTQYTVKVECVGSSIKTYVNNIAQITVTDSFNSTATKLGMRTGIANFPASACSWDNLNVVTPVGLPVVVQRSYVVGQSVKNAASY